MTKILSGVFFAFFLVISFAVTSSSLIPYTEAKAAAEEETSRLANESEFTVKTQKYNSRKYGHAAARSVVDFTIQLSSFTSEDEASRALSAVRANLPDAWMSTAQVEGTTRYRIYCGHFKGLDEALAAKSKIAAKAGITDAFVQRIAAKLTAKND